MSKLLLDEQPLVLLPELAALIGLNEAIILQQINYWLNKKGVGRYHDGQKWVRNTYDEWQENFPFWSKRTIQRILDNLREAGLIQVANLNKTAYDRTNWYTIDYDHLDKLTTSKQTTCPDQSGQTDHIEEDNLARPIPETTAETTTETTADISEPEKEILPTEAQRVKELADKIDPTLEGDLALDVLGLGKEYQEKYGNASTSSGNDHGPWLTWANESQVIGPRFGIRQDQIQRVGYLLETRYGLAPPLGNKSRMKHWINGCAELYQATDGDMDVIKEAGDALRRDGMTLSQPQSFYNKVVAVVGEKRSGGGKKGVITIGR